MLVFINNKIWFLITCLVCISIQVRSQTDLINWDVEQGNSNWGNLFWMNILHADQKNVHFIVSSSSKGKQNQFVVNYDRVQNTKLVYNLNQGKKQTEVISSIVQFNDSIIDIYSLLFEGSNLLTYREKIKSNTFEVVEHKSLSDKEMKNDEFPNISNISSDMEAIYTDIKQNEIYDKNGNLYVVNNASVDGKEESFVIVCYPKSKQKSIILPMSIGTDKKIRSFRLGINENNEILCAGVFSDPLSKSMNGCYSIKYSTLLNKIIDASTFDFAEKCLFKSSTTIDSCRDTVSCDVNMNEMQNFKYISPQIHFNKDGGFTLVIEKYNFSGIIEKPDFVTNYTINGPRTSTVGETKVKNYYHFSDLIIANFNEQGYINWMRRIPKKCFIINEAWSSGSFYSVFDNEDKLHLIYNEINSDKFSCRISESKTNYSILTKFGEITTKVIEGDLDKSKYISPAFFRQIDNSSVLTVRFNYTKSGLGSSNLKNRFSFGSFKLN